MAFGNFRQLITIDRMTLIYTFLIYFNNFAFGITVRIISTMLVDLSYVYHTTVNQVAYINFSIGIGYLIGSLGNILYRWLNRQITLGAFLILLATLFTLSPHYSSLLQLLIAIAIGSVGSGAWDSATSIWLVEMWPVGNAALLQGSQFMYGLGSISAPLLASPYLYGHQNTTVITDYGQFHNETAVVYLTSEMRSQSLSTPLILCGLTQSIGPILYFVLYFFMPFQKKSIQNSIEDLEKKTESLSSDSVPYRKWKVILIGMAGAIYIAAELGHFSFAASMYQLLQINLSASEAARVQSTSLATYTLGRLFAAFISLRIKPDLMLGAHYTIVLGSLLLIYIGRNSLNFIYLGNALIGLGFSAMWPGMFAFTEHYLGLTPGVCSMFSALAGIAMLIIPVILAQMFEKMPLVLVAVEALFIFTSFAFFIVTRIWIWLKPAVQSHAKFGYPASGSLGQYGMDNPVYCERDTVKRQPPVSI